MHQAYLGGRDRAVRVGASRRAGPGGALSAGSWRRSGERAEDLGFALGRLASTGWHIWHMRQLAAGPGEPVG